MTENNSVCLDNYYIRKQSTDSSDIVSTSQNGLMTSSDKIKLNTLDPHPNNLPAYSLGLYKIATNTNGHITSAVAVTKNDILALGISGEGSGEGATSSGTYLTESDLIDNTKYDIDLDISFGLAGLDDTITIDMNIVNYIVDKTINIDGDD